MHRWDRDHHRRYVHTGRYDARAAGWSERGMTAERKARSGRQS
jgi:hypothetical protein